MYWRRQMWLLMEQRRENIHMGIYSAHVVGYSVQGKAGLEAEENYELLTSNAFFLEKLKNEFQDQKNQGDTW